MSPFSPLGVVTLLKPGLDRVDGGIDTKAQNEEETLKKIKMAQEEEVDRPLNTQGRGGRDRHDGMT